MQNPSHHTQQNDSAAVLYMLAAMLSYSWIPLTISVNQGADNPLLFSGIWRMGTLTTYLTLLITLYRPLINRADLTRTFRLLAAPRHSWLIIIGATGTMEYGMFALSTRYLDVAVTSIVFELWPITSIFMIAWLYKRKIPRRTYIFAPICFLGFIFVAASQHGGLNQLQNQLAASPVALVMGFTPAITGVILGSMAVCSLKAGSLLSENEEMQKTAERRGITRPLDRFCTLLIFITCNTISIPSSIAISLITEGPSDFTIPFQQLSAGALTIIPGGAFLAIGAVLWQSSIARTNRVAINSINCLTPVLALAWLWAFHQVGDVKTGHLLTGTGVILAANLWINLEPNNSHSNEPEMRRTKAGQDKPNHPRQET